MPAPDDRFLHGTEELVVSGPEPFQLEDLLKYVDPAPDDETEQFVAAIYADRQTTKDDLNR